MDKYRVEFLKNGVVQFSDVEGKTLTQALFGEIARWDLVDFDIRKQMNAIYHDKAGNTYKFQEIKQI